MGAPAALGQQPHVTFRSLHAIDADLNMRACLRSDRVCLPAPRRLHYWQRGRRQSSLTCRLWGVSLHHEFRSVVSPGRFGGRTQPKAIPVSARAAQAPKRSRGRKALTIQFGASTTSLILRSTATLART